MHVSRKVKVGVGAAVACLAISGAAFAYFTTTGTGSATGTAGTSSVLAITGTAPTALLPGTSSVVNFSVNNPSAGNQFVSTISLASVTASDAGCLSGWFSMPTVTANQNVASGTVAITTTGLITLNNDPIVNQDACKLATLTLNLTSN